MGMSGGLVLPAMRKKFDDFAERLGWQARQDILQISEGVMAIEFGGLNQAHDGGRALAGPQAAGEEPVLPPGGQFALILPISGKKLKSIIAGIPCTATASRFETSSNAATRGSMFLPAGVAGARTWL